MHSTAEREMTTETATKPMVSTYPEGVESYQFEYQWATDSQSHHYAVVASSEDEAAAWLVTQFLGNGHNPQWAWYRLIRISRWDGTNWKGHAAKGQTVRNLEVAA